MARHTLTSTAFPPLHVLRAGAACPDCGRAAGAYALLSSGLHDGVEDGTFGGLIVLTDIRSLPRGVLALLRERCPGWRFDQEGPSEPPYLMNHCLRCGGQLADRHLHAGPGSAFYPRGEWAARAVVNAFVLIEQAAKAVVATVVIGVQR